MKKGAHISRKLGLYFLSGNIYYSIWLCNLKMQSEKVSTRYTIGFLAVPYILTYICDGTAQFCLFLCRIITFQLLVRTMNFHMAAWAHCKYMRATESLCLTTPETISKQVKVSLNRDLHHVFAVKPWFQLMPSVINSWLKQLYESYLKCNTSKKVEFCFE